MTAELAEQPEDWTEPGAYPLVPGVHRVPLTGLRAVNVSVVDGPEGPTLVDSGWAGDDAGLVIEGLRRPVTTCPTWPGSR